MKTKLFFIIAVLIGMVVNSCSREIYDSQGYVYENFPKVPCPESKLPAEICFLCGTLGVSCADISKSRIVFFELDIIEEDHHHINLSYIGKIIGGEMLSESDEGTELKWFSLSEILDCQDRIIIPDLRSKIFF